MTEPVVLDLLQGALVVAAKVAAPILLASLAVGLETSLLQAATQMQENVISFVPKVLAVVATLTLAGRWALQTLTDYGTLVIRTMAELGRVGGGAG